MELVRPWHEPICGMQVVLQELGKDAEHCSDTSLLAAWLCKIWKIHVICIYVPYLVIKLDDFSILHFVFERISLGIKV